MKNLYRASLIETLEALEMPIVEFSLQVPKNKKFGDLATNVAFILSKSLGKNPIDIAESIKKELDKTNNFSLVSIAKPGFINLKLNPTILVNQLNNILVRDTSFFILFIKFHIIYKIKINLLFIISNEVINFY